MHEVRSALKVISALKEIFIAQYAKILINSSIFCVFIGTSKFAA